MGRPNEIIGIISFVACPGKSARGEMVVKTSYAACNRAASAAKIECIAWKDMCFVQRHHQRWANA